MLGGQIEALQNQNMGGSANALIEQTQQPNPQQHQDNTK